MKKSNIKLPSVILLCMVCLALLSGCMMPAAAGQPVEPDAGQWKTWVLASADELRPAAPPDQAATMKEIADLKTMVSQRDDAAADTVAYWDAGSPSYRWIQIALAEAKAANISHPANARAMALMNVAIYDALVTAWNAKYHYNRPRPSVADPSLTTLVAVPDSPSYPSEHAVAAGAAATVLGYIFPDDAQKLEAKAEEAANSRLMAGVQYASDVQEGLDLGKQVAMQVIERAKGDGYGAKWEGQVTTEPGHWNGQNPIEPMFGKVKPWVLTSADQFRAPPPYAYDSPEKAAELTEIESFTRTWQTNQKAEYWQTYDGIHTVWFDTASKDIFEHHLDSNPPYAAYVYTVLSVARMDGFIACWDSKYTYWAIRPFQLDPKVVTLFPTPNHPSYPAAHGCISTASAAALEPLFPAEAAAVKALADEAAISRMWAGIHYPSDIEQGQKLGQSVGDLVAEHAKAMIESQ
jgi:membrane-associated phospholipid phosphatase